MSQSTDIESELTQMLELADKAIKNNYNSMPYVKEVKTRKI